MTSLSAGKDFYALLGFLLLDIFLVIDHLGYPRNDVPSLTHPRSSPARPQEHFRRAVKKRLNLTVSQYTINLQVEWCCTNVQSVTAQEAFGCLGRKAQPPDTLAASGCKVKPAYLMLSNVAKK